MEDAAEGKRAKDRSPTFPFISLESALERARQFYAEEKRGAAPYARVVLHWKYSPASSGALQTAAALKNYGLLNELGGSGMQRQLQLSDLALRILLDSRPDSEERAQYVRQAALSPGVVREVYERWPEGLPSESTLNHFLVLDKKFNEATARRVVKILQENQEFAKVEHSDVSSEHDKIPPETKQAVPILTAPSLSAERAPTPRTMQTSASAPQIAQASVAAFEENLLTDEGEAVAIHFPRKPTSAHYKWLAEYAEFKASRLEKVEKAAAQLGRELGTSATIVDDAPSVS